MTTNTTVNITINSVFNSNSLVLNKYYPYSGQDSIYISKLNFYIQNPTFVDANNSSVVTNSVFLYSLELAKNTLTFSSNKLSAAYTNLSFLVGLDDATNRTNPTSVSSSDPLGNSDMWWTSWTKYRFIVIEGNYKKADGTSIPISYHTGLTYRNTSTISSNYNLNIGSSNSITLTLHVEDIFNGNNNKMNLVNGENITHVEAGQEAITTKVIDNFKYALRKD